MLGEDFMPSGARGRHCFTAEVAGGKQGEAVAAAAAATAAVASDLRVFSLAGGKERALVAARWSTALR